MKTKKQRKITAAQLKGARAKFILLEHKRVHIVKQTTPLKIMVRKYIQQNMQEIEVYIASAGAGSKKLHWAVEKIKFGYFGDALLKDLIEITHILTVVKWEGSH